MRTFKISVITAMVFGWALLLQPGLKPVSVYTPKGDPIGQLIEMNASEERMTSSPTLVEDIAWLITPHCGGSEHLWLACALYHEARNQPIFGQYLVAQVILNRVTDKRWPKTIEAVVRQGEENLNACQFSFRCDGKPKPIAELSAWAVALRVAAEAIEDYRAGKKVTCAHSYHADYVTSKRALAWFATLQAERQEGSHIFFCDK